MMGRACKRFQVAITLWLVILGVSSTGRLFAEPNDAPPEQASEPAKDVALTDQTMLHFATIEQGQAVLNTRDGYVQRLSPFDRQSRLASDKPVKEAQYLEFASQQVEEFTPEEIDRVTAAAESLSKRIAKLRLKLPLPKVVEIIKTSGREEAGAAYTRGTSIILPRRRMATGPDPLERLLAHELFHVLSRHDPAARAQLYAVIGFRPSPGVELPEKLRPLQITNPDGPRYDYSIRVMHEEQPVEVVPVLYASGPYDPKQERSFFGYLEFRLMVVDKTGEQYSPRLTDGEPTMLTPGELPDFHRQIGHNTGYIIHPDEILADNFVYLLTQKPGLKSPQVVEGMRRVLGK